MQLPEYLTPLEARTMLRVSKPTYYRMVKAGTIVERRTSPRRSLVAKADIEAILSGKKSPVPNNLKASSI